VLEVVATKVRRLLVHWAQHVEPPEQMHRWPHPYEHLAEVGEDHQPAWSVVIDVEAEACNAPVARGRRRRVTA
jgi:hypothetical protein